MPAHIGGGSALMAAPGPVNDKLIDDHLAVQAIIRSYQVKSFVILFLFLSKILFED